MQGFNETGGCGAPATFGKTGYKKYMPTLMAFTVPAVAASMAAALIYADAKPRNVPQIDLATRAEMVRLAAGKTPFEVGPSVSLTRTNSEHPPLDDVSLVTTSDVDVAKR
jgi:hypothetical protein